RSRNLGPFFEGSRNREKSCQRGTPSEAMIRNNRLDEPADGASLASRLRMLRKYWIAGWSRSPRTVEVKQRLEMNWACPVCRARNAVIIASDAETGKIVEVSCQACETQHEASVFFPPAQIGVPMTVGVVWV